MWEVVALALGRGAYRLDVVQQLASTVQHLLLVALQRPRVVASESALGRGTQRRLVQVVDVPVDLLD